MGLRVAMISSWGVKCGIYTYTRDLANGLASHDVEVYIVRLPRFGLKNAEILFDVLSRIPIEKVDLLHCQHEYGLYQGLEGRFFDVLKRLGKPLVTTMHAIGNWGTDSIVAEASNKVIVHNEFCHKNFGFPSTIIPHGTKPVKCPPIEECKKGYGIDPKIPIIGYVGFISQYKGIETIIEATSKIPNVALVIGGGWHIDIENEYIAKLKQWTSTGLRGRSQWLGFIPEEKLASVYGAMDIVLYPSRFSTESGALLMAISHGKAVIASKALPFKEKEREGALMTFEDVDDLVEKIKFLIKNPEEKQKLEEGARNYAESVEWGKVGQKHIELYESILTHKPN